ncbi:MAG: response regulator transcription factor [Candidatus Nitrohelix vancouverensis]|uniref:Response regulator transcription factor n=1 Tax=Candidatus Nitrohelix vancouverensis TaxID=2705534 RepID=A0A7T0C475_9BACT|nr:MAG: response regulator transcription factor [Candidatus Nitrohelix vancouverensis]
MASTIKIFITDDHTIFREGLKKLLSSYDDMQVIGEADNGEQTLVDIRKVQPDIILLDIAMPELSGLEVLTQLNMEFPDLKVIILSMYSEEQHEIRMLQTGASAYITKGASKEQLVDGIRKVYQGEKVVSPYLSQKIAMNFGKKQTELPLDTLSNREFQVLRLIASGKTVSQIGEILHISVKTVSAHRSHILDKLQMHSNSELIRFALDEGLI